MKKLKDCSFNQKVALTALIIAGAGAIPTWLGYWESRKERIKADEAKKATENLAMETADMVALIASYTGWGIDAVPDFPARNKFYETTLSNAVSIIRSAKKDPGDFAGVRQLQGAVNLLKGTPGLVNRPSTSGLEHNSGFKTPK